MVNPTPESIRKDYEYNLKRIYDEITHYYNQDTLVNLIIPKFDADDLHEVSKQVIGLIIKHYEISIQLVISDYLAEVERKKKFGIELNDIPTYQLSFALEEGSWIVFLRDHYPNSLLHKYDRLKVLEELLWETGKGQVEDYIFYLIELEQISKLYIHSVFLHWKANHMEGNTIEIVERMIASINKVGPENAKLLFNGAVRVLKSKIDGLSKIKTIKNISPLIQDALNILDRIEEELISEDYTDYTLALITTISLYQMEMLKDKQELKRKKIETNEHEKESEIIEKLNWHSLDPLDFDMVNEYREIILTMLYEMPHEDAMLAAKSLLQMIFGELKVRKSIQEDVLNKFEDEIEDRTASIKDEIECERVKVELIQLFLPNMLLRLKSIPNVYDIQDKRELQVQNPEHWDSFEDSLKRACRIKDQERYVSTITSIIRNTYMYLLNQRIQVNKAYEIILDKYIKRYPKNIINRSELLVNIREKLLSLDETRASHSEIDEAIVTELSSQISRDLCRRVQS